MVFPAAELSTLSVSVLIIIKTQQLTITQGNALASNSTLLGNSSWSTAQSVPGMCAQDTCVPMGLVRGRCDFT